MAAIGCLPPGHIEPAAADIYKAGIHNSGQSVRIRLVAVGAIRNDELAGTFPAVTQLVWFEMLEFMWDRFHTYRSQKTQVDQWDQQGLLIKGIADQTRNSAKFVEIALARMGVRRANG